MEWHGVFAVDHHSLQNYRKSEGNVDYSTNPNALLGTQEIAPSPGGKSNAGFETYIIKLRPTLTINDAASFFAELTTGYGRGGFYGDGPVQNYAGSFGNALYYLNLADNNNPINLNQFYMELYSDTATYQIGRTPEHFGMGIVLNEGSGTWDRFATTRDQIKIKFKLGNFEIDPFIGKIGVGNSLTSSTDALEFGVPLFYEVAESDLTFGVIWVNKRIAGDFDGYKFNMRSFDPTKARPLGQSNTNLIDVYLKKVWGKFKFELEVPFFTGVMGDLYAEGEEAKYRAMAGVMQMSFKFNDYWKIGLDGGYVSGDDGGEDSYDAMFLNPNFKIAKILFGYNRDAISSFKEPGNPFDVYVTNTTYVRLYGAFVTGKWNMDLTAIYAIANEAAETGKQAYNHQRNKLFIADYDQDKGLGLELDYTLSYKWNDEINVGVDLAYLMAGDYFAYTNTDTPNELKNPWLFKLLASLDF